MGENVLVFRVLDRDAAVPGVPRAGWSGLVAAFDVFGVLGADGEDVRDPELGVVAQRQRCRQAAEREGKSSQRLRGTHRTHGAGADSTQRAERANAQEML